MKQTIQLSILSSINLGILFLFQWYVLVELGPGIETDALFASMTVPLIVLAIVSSSLMHVLVPVLSGEDENRLRQDAWSFLILVGGLFAAIAIFLYWTAPWWVILTVPGFGESATLLTIELTRIQLVGMVFSAVNSVQWATYHARQKFIWAEFSPILTGIFAFLILFWALPRYGVIAAAWIFTVRVGLQTFLLAPGMGVPHKPNLRSYAFSQAWKRIKPLLLATTYYKTDPLLDRFLLSMATSGSLSLFYLAQQIYGAANQIVNKAIVVPLVPAMSSCFKDGNFAGFVQMYRRRLAHIAAICVVILLTIGLFGRVGLEYLIGQGNVSESNVDKLWWIMIWLGGMFIGGAMGQIVSSAFYACGDTKTPSRMSVVTYTIYVPSKVISFFVGGVFGLALSTSIYYMVNLLLLMFFLLKKNLHNEFD